MGVLRTTGRTAAAAVGLAAGAASCTGSGQDPARIAGPAVTHVNPGKNTAPSAPAIADALSRILPVIDPASADALRGPLTTISNQVAAGNTTALRAGIAAARAALVVASAIDADVPDLDAVALAIDSVDPALGR